MKAVVATMALGLTLIAPSALVARKVPSKPVTTAMDLNNFNVDLNVVCFSGREDPTTPSVISFSVHHVKGEDRSKRNVDLYVYNNTLDRIMTDPIREIKKTEADGAVSYEIVGGGPAVDRFGNHISDNIEFIFKIHYTPEDSLRADLFITSKELSLVRRDCSIPPPMVPATGSKK